jgi:hypothetical protein
MPWRIFCVKTKWVCSSRTVVWVLRHYREQREELNAGLTAAILHEDEEQKVPDDVKLVFYAEAELAVRRLSLELETSTNVTVT